MADNFEKAKDEILRRTAGNGGPQNADILDAMSALAQDGDDQHSESIAEVKALRGLLAAHCEEAAVRDDRIKSLENWKTDQSEHCVERVKHLIAQEHSLVHAAHMAAEHVENPRRSGDKSDSDHTKERQDSIAAIVGPIEKKMWVLWAIFIFVIVEAGHALVMWFVERAAGN